MDHITRLSVNRITVVMLQPTQAVIVARLCSNMLFCQNMIWQNDCGLPLLKAICCLPVNQDDNDNVLLMGHLFKSVSKTLVLYIDIFVTVVNLFFPKKRNTEGPCRFTALFVVLTPFFTHSVCIVTNHQQYNKWITVLILTTLHGLGFQSKPDCRSPCYLPE